MRNEESLGLYVFRIPHRAVRHIGGASPGAMILQVWEAALAA